MVRSVVPNWAMHFTQFRKKIMQHLHFALVSSGIFDILLFGRKFSSLIQLTIMRILLLYSSLFTVNGSNDTIQLNNEKKQQQRNAIGTQYTLNSLAYKHFMITPMVTECHCSEYIYITLFHHQSNGNQEKQQKYIAQSQ